MKDLRELNDLTIHDVKPISPRNCLARARALCFWFVVCGLWFRVSGSGFRVEGEGLGERVQGSWPELRPAAQTALG